MRGSDYAELLAFVSVAEERSSGAPPSGSASRPRRSATPICGLEERLGAKLLNCATRSVALMEAG